jgi:hypothetical protein
LSNKQLFSSPSKTRGATASPAARNEVRVKGNAEWVSLIKYEEERGRALSGLSFEPTGLIVQGQTTVSDDDRSFLDQRDLPLGFFQYFSANGWS